MMKRAKGATLAEIMSPTKWQTHTVRGFVVILGSRRSSNLNAASRFAGGGVSACVGHSATDGDVTSRRGPKS
jgi:hypothetical protein